MKWVERLSLVRELRDQITRQRLEIIEMRADIKKMVDVIASSHGVLQPFASRGNPADWGTVRRQSIAREIMDFEAKHAAKDDD